MIEGGTCWCPLFLAILNYDGATWPRSLNLFKLAEPGSGLCPTSLDSTPCCPMIDWAWLLHVQSSIPKSGQTVNLYDSSVQLELKANISIADKPRASLVVTSHSLGKLVNFRFSLMCPSLVSNFLCNQGWPWVSDPPASTSWMLRLQHFTTIPDICSIELHTRQASTLPPEPQLHPKMYNY